MEKQQVKFGMSSWSYQDQLMDFNLIDWRSAFKTFDRTHPTFLSERLSISQNRRQ